MSDLKTARFVSESNVALDIPFVPSTQIKIETMLKLLGDIRGKTAADLGSGDGRLVVELAKRGAFVFGFELEPMRVAISNLKIANHSLEGRAQILQRDFFEADLSKFDIIVLYGITSMMTKLEKKLHKELKAGSKVVSNTFEFPTWQPVNEENDVFLYIKE